MSMMETPRKSAWIPWVFVGAMLIVTAVNGVMVTYALKSFSGLAVEKPYERGVQYNKILAAKAQQDRLGWTIAAKVEGRRLSVTLSGRDGAPLDSASITGDLERPLGKLDPVPLSFAAAGDGRYVASLEGVPQHGQWDITATIHHGDDRYLLVERLFIP